MKRVLQSILLILLTVPVCYAETVRDKKTILYINSYQNGYGWSDNILKGIRSELEKSGLRYDLQIEYMDTKKYFDPEMKPLFYNLYLHKYQKNRPDVVLLSDNNAFDFVLKYRESLFPEIPVVFCGINDFDPEVIKDLKNIGGVVESLDVSGNIDIALKLHPQRTRLIVVADRSTTGRAIVSQIKKKLKGVQKNITAEFWDYSGPSLLIPAVRKIDTNSIVFFCPQFSSDAGVFYSAEETLALITENTTAPVYCFWEFMLGKGIVGGNLTSGVRHGETAAGMAAKILKGAPASGIGVVYEEQYKSMFDYNRLMKYEIDPALLPEKSRLINQPSRFYELNKQVARVLVVSFAMISIALLFLVVSIARLKTAQAGLEAAEEKYRSIFENAAKGIFISDIKGQLINVNPAFARMLGFESGDDAIEEINRAGSSHFLKNRHSQFWQKISIGHEVTGFELEFFNRSGELRWASVNAKSVSKDDGGYDYIEGIVEDITQRKQAEMALTESRRNLQLVLDNIPQLVFWQDTNLTYVGGNKSFKAFYGLDEDQEITGKTDADLLSDPIDIEKNRILDLSVMASGNPQYGIKQTIRKQSGEKVWLEVNKIPLRDGEGKCVGILSTAEDITKKVTLEKQLLQSQKMDALGRLSGGIAHDFNNILTSIINSTELALEDIEAGTEVEKDLKRVLSASNRGSRLVNQILTFSRPSIEDFKLVNIADVVTEAMSLIKPTLPGNVETRASVHPDGCLCQAIPTQIHQIVMNLCTNSFQAMKKTGGSIDVRVAPVQVSASDTGAVNVPPGRYCNIRVSDNGPGIRPDHMDKIFDPFFSTKEKEVGTGLGLSVVHGILKGHSGGISVKSLPGVETVFDIYLPESEEAQKPGQGNSADADTEQALFRGRGTILFVEDDADQRETVPRVLRQLGYTLLVSENGMQALEVMASSKDRVDLVITDFDMPGINGIELAEALYELSPQVPVIVVSGRRESMTSGSTPNIREIIIKPYNRQTISESVRSILEPNGSAEA